jgi:hypothetical protein
MKAKMTANLQGETGSSGLPRLLAGLENGSERKYRPKGDDLVKSQEPRHCEERSDEATS